MVRAARPETPRVVNSGPKTDATRPLFGVASRPRVFALGVLCGRQEGDQRGALLLSKQLELVEPSNDLVAAGAFFAPCLDQRDKALGERHAHSRCNVFL